MHEQSLVRALLRQVDRTRRAAGGGQVVGVRVSLGPLSGVEPLLVQNAFAILAPETLGAQVELTIEMVALSAVCRGCEHEFQMPDFDFRCPRCGGRAVRVTGGDAFQLVSVEVRQSEAIAGALE